MAIKDGGFAPYAPSASVVTLLELFRERGSPSPITQENLEKVSIKGSVAARVIQTLKALDLIDKEGKPLEAFEVLRKVPTDQYKERLSEIIRGAYAEVFKFTDPAKDDIQRLKDAFRGYTPEPQRDRMVMLFVGLCKYAGIVKGGVREASGAREMSTQRPRPKVARQGRHFPDEGGKTDSEFPPALKGLMLALPVAKGTWTSTERNKFMTAFNAVLDMTITVDDNPPHADEEVEDKEKGEDD